jgi:hypothetical protein
VALSIAALLCGISSRRQSGRGEHKYGHFKENLHEIPPADAIPLSSR